MIISYKDQFVNFITELQNEISSELENLDGSAKFISDKWVRAEGGGGDTRILKNGTVFEKAGVNTSVVHGELSPVIREKLGVEYGNFFACGLSLVIHPLSPMVPTVHANYRYFELYDENNEVVDQWFGGGSDLTPYYIFDEDPIHFHSTLKNVCDQFDPSFYKKFKLACDNYFHNAHRNEARGVGGLFFDYLRANENQDGQFWYNFVTSQGKAFLPSYLPIVEKRKTIEYNDDQKFWQEVRRGRYVEFNLIHDRGTLFGLKTNGRIESILMSLPSLVRWEYNHIPEVGTEEDKLIQVLKNPKNWLNVS